MTPQSQFRAALFDASRPTPDGLSGPLGRPAKRRFNVYRNNVAVSLRTALETGFPATVRLIGPENFAIAAGRYLREEPPTSPLMMHYGAGFPAFLETLPQIQHLGYLPDIARLELAIRRSYHAADRAPIDPATLQTIPEETLFGSHLTLAPAVQLVRSPWPIAQIHRFTLTPGSPKPKAVAEDVLVTRPEFDPMLDVLPAKGGMFVEALNRSLSLADAISAAGEGFNLNATLALLFRQSALTDVTTP